MKDKADATQEGVEGAIAYLHSAVGTVKEAVNTPTGIDAAKSNAATDTQYYDLNGRRTAKHMKGGLYVVNGRIVSNITHL